MRLPDIVWWPVSPPPQPATATIPSPNRLTISLRARRGAPNGTVEFAPPRCLESADLFISMPPILVVDRCRRSLGVNDEKRSSTSPQEALYWTSSSLRRREKPNEPCSES